MLRSPAGRFRCRRTVVAKAQTGNGTQKTSQPVMRPLGPPPSVRHGATAPSGNGTGGAVATEGAAAVDRSTPSQQGVVVFERPIQADAAVKHSAAQLADVLRQQREQREEQSAGVIIEGTDDDAVPDARFAWAQDNYNERLRGLQIWTFFVVVRTSLALLDQKWTYIGGFTAEKRSARATLLAVYARESILELGPTFIKIGQLLSTRSDLLGPEFVQELSKLQDRVPVFSPDRAIQIIESQLGQPVTRLFKSFQRRPIAAASLGQVHRATLWNDQDVVVKVQRPGLRRLFDIDLKSLRQIAAALDAVNENDDLTSIYQECADVLYKEIDYLQEGRNAARFKRNFRGTDWVRVPSVEWSHTTPQVLTLEYVPGVKITDVVRMRSGRIDGKLVARRATEAYLIQILQHGFFHADPHPGNFAVDRASRLIYYDFGMMGEIVPNVKTSLLDVFRGVYEKDPNRVIDALIILQVIKVTGGDKISLLRSIRYFIDNIQLQTKRGETINAIGEDLFAIALDEPLRFPATFTFVLRAFSTLEGIGKLLDSDYVFSEVAAPYAQQLLLASPTASSQSAFILEQVQQQATVVAQAAAQAPLRIEYLESTVRRMEEGELKLRVRVLESERAARRQGVLQTATINTIALFGCLQLGSTFALNAQDGQATAFFILSSVFAVRVLLGFRRVRNLDKFEKDLRK